MAGAYRMTSCGLSGATPASLLAMISAPASCSCQMLARMAGIRFRTSANGDRPGTGSTPMVRPTTV
jgi:hypothetical protein